MNAFEVVSPFEPQGDQPQAIDMLANGVQRGDKLQVLLGVTGSGKTFTMAKVIERVQKPTLVISHNKTLAAQLCSEFREFFPDRAVEYFVSYYDYSAGGVYRLVGHLSKRSPPSTKRSISCATAPPARSTSAGRYHRCVGFLHIRAGRPEEYLRLSISLRRGMRIERDDVMRKLVDIQYQRNDFDFARGTFRARGDVLEIFPMNWSEKALRVEFFGDEVERISEVNVVTGEILLDRAHVAIFPASHYATSRDKLNAAMQQIEDDLYARVRDLKAQDKLVEAQRLEQRTLYDMEMMRELGYCSGIENYSRYFDGASPASRRLRCWIIFRTIFCCSWMKAMSRYRRCAACTAGIARARMRWWNTASVSRRRTTTGPSNSRNLKRESIRSCAFRPRPPTMSWACARRWPSRSYAPPALSTPKSPYAPSKGRWTIYWERCGRRQRRATVRSSPR
jgi:excinuclease ABC subunit B